MTAIDESALIRDRLLYDHDCIDRLMTEGRTAIALHESKAVDTLGDTIEELDYQSHLSEMKDLNVESDTKYIREKADDLQVQVEIVQKDIELIKTVLEVSKRVKGLKQKYDQVAFHINELPRSKDIEEEIMLKKREIADLEASIDTCVKDQQTKKLKFDLAISGLSELLESSA